MKQVCDKQKCTGCYACANICPKKCIVMKEDDYGFFYSEIDEQSCINCGVCVKTCPAVCKTELRQPSHVYAAINKSKYDYESATSGGMATLFSRKILEKGGVVYGAVMDENLDVKHIRAECQEELEQIKGSKYVQSKIGNIYINIKQDLETGRKVLFIGTPCQNAGLKNYLKKDYKELYTCDLICHGVPSQKYLREHIEEVTDLNSIKKISFRDKEGFYLTLTDGEKVCYRKKNFYDIYFLAFLKALLYRDSCYTCAYAQSNRVGDVTLGDFWGFDSSKGNFPVSTSDGLSLVMINTEKGQNLFNNCADSMICIERSLEEAVNGNKQLRAPSVKHKKYKVFKKQYLKSGFEKAAKRALWKERIIYALLDRIGK